MRGHPEERVCVWVEERISQLPILTGLLQEADSSSMVPYSLLLPGSACLGLAVTVPQRYPLT